MGHLKDPSILLKITELHGCPWVYLVIYILVYISNNILTEIKNKIISLYFLVRYYYNWYFFETLDISFAGVFSCCNGDTWASELGTVFAKSDPILITSWKKVPKGTNGGVTPAGILFSVVGGLIIGLSYYLSILYFTDKVTWTYAPPQWPVILFGGLAGFIGSLIDSFMGATIQYSGTYFFKI